MLEKKILFISIFLYSHCIFTSSENVRQQLISHSNHGRDIEADLFPPSQVSSSISSSTESLPDQNGYEPLSQVLCRPCSKENRCKTIKYAAGTFVILGATAGLTYFASWLGPDLASISQQLPEIHQDLDVLTTQVEQLLNISETILGIVSKL